MAGNNDQTGIQAKGGVQTDTSTPGTGVIALSAFPEIFNRDRLGATDAALTNSDVEVHPEPGLRTTGGDFNTLTSTAGHTQDAISGVIKVVSSVGYRKPDNLIQLDDGQIQTGQTAPDKRPTEIDRVQNAGQVYGCQTPDVQLQDPRATIVCDTAPFGARQPPGRHVGNRCSPRQDDDDTLETNFVHVGDQLHGGSEIVAIEIGRERFGPMVDQLPDAQMQSKTATLTFKGAPPPATQLPGEQIQTRRKRTFLISDGLIHDNETEAEYTVTASLDSGPTAGIAPFRGYPAALAPIAPTRRRKMQSMIDEMNQDVGDPVPCAGLSSCLLAAPELYRSPFNPAVSHAPEGAPSPSLGLRNPLKRRVAIGSGQAQTTGSMNGDPESIAPATAGPTDNGRSADDELYQDLSAQTQPGSGRVKLVCLVWLLVFVLLGILEFL